jgi:hypothetical protein
MVYHEGVQGRSSEVTMGRHRTPRLFATAALFAALALVGCSGSITATFEPDGGAYDDTALEDLLNGYDLGDAADVATVDSVGIREDVLIDLRTKGDDAGAVADILTRDFPVETEAVPVLIEAGTYAGTDSWIVLEAWGDDDGNLTHARVWVFDRESGSLLYSASRR